MKVPLSWLRDYVDLNLPVAQLAERLTLAGLEVGGVRLIGLPPPEGLRVKGEDAGPIWDRDKIVIGQVVEVVCHPDADKLTLPTVDLGGGRRSGLPVRADISRATPIIDRQRAMLGSTSSSRTMSPM